MKGKNGQEAMAKRLFSVKESAFYLSVSQWTVRERIGAGLLPAVKIGHRLLLDRADLDRFIEMNKSWRT
jgi:excisionase family DNA binding protein